MGDSPSKCKRAWGWDILDRDPYHLPSFKGAYSTSDIMHFNSAADNKCPVEIELFPLTQGYKVTCPPWQDNPL